MLDIIPGLLLLVAVIFIFLIVALNKMLYKPLLGFMDERERSIQEDMEKAKANSSNVSHLEEEAAKILKDAKSQAFKIREEAVNEVKEEIAKKIEEKRAALEKSYEAFVAELESEKEELRSKLTSKLPEFQNSLKAKLSQI
ncbi:MAG: F0F1 ATP synthase subunit B' [Epsilonproteobacteria bacterium]|nr:F0F1 ATP synthase subunit B' [Campylobacterota bacterium]